MHDPAFYCPLLKTVSILLVDDDPSQLDLYEAILSDHPLYTVTKAATARDAEKAIRSVSPIHLCLLDSGIDDINNDGYYLLKKYSYNMPFVIISDSRDIERAFEAAQYGAAGMIAKPLDMHSPRFWEKLSDVFLQKTILPDNPTTTNSQLGVCCRILKDDLPGTVSEWAAQANITEAYMRKIWSKRFALPPKHVLFMYKVYRNAFAYYNALYLSKLNGTEPRIQEPDQEEHFRLMCYYLENKNVLKKVRDKEKCNAMAA